MKAAHVGGRPLGALDKFNIKPGNKNALLGVLGR